MTNLMYAKKGIRYVVVRGQYPLSHGDRVWVNQYGWLFCKEAKGYLEERQWRSLDRVLLKVDSDYYMRRRGGDQGVRS